MAEQQNLQTIRDAYAAFVRGDIAGVLAHLSDDVVWETQGPSQIPYAGVFHGKDGVSKFFQILGQTEDVQAFEPERFFADGDMVVVLGRYAARVKANGNDAKTQWVHTFTFREGKIAKYCEYLDTAAFAQAYEAAGALT